ncbi:MAG: Hpt domain-containing protein [Pirellulales bacterium]|nr:Hpt domain-containing protein [Pirellulales bacterium]
MSPSGAEVDWSHALEAVRGDRGLLRSMVRTFLEEYPRRLGEMQRAVEEQVAKPLQLAAHSLKGPLRFFGAQWAFQLALQVENLARDGRIEDGAAVLAELETALLALEPRWREFIQQE